MEDKSIDELALSAAEKPTAPLLGEILEGIRQSAEFSDGTKNALDLMVEAWGEKIDKDVMLSNFIIAFCSLINFTTSPIRHALAAAIKAQLPPYLAKQGLQRALGFRERHVMPPEVVCRFRNLLALQPNMLCWQPETRLFSKVDGLDDLTGSVVLSSIPEATSYRIPLEQALTAFIFLSGTANARKLIQPGRKTAFTAIQWREEIKKYAVKPLTPTEIQEMARTVYIPGIMTADEFVAWWKSDAVTVKPFTSGRGPEDARSILELSVLLKERMEASPSFRLGDNEAEKLAAFFNRQRVPSQLKDVKLIADVICQLTNCCSATELRTIFADFKNKLAFWPQGDIRQVVMADLEIWGALSAKQLPDMIRASDILFTLDHLAVYATLLPLKAVSALFAELGPDGIFEAAHGAPYISADMLVWIWKNRRADGQRLLDLLTMENVINAIVMLELPKAWGAAQRELKKLLIDDLSLIKTVIDNAGDDVRTIIYAVQRAKGFNQGEQQSLLVKLSRHSDALKLILEGGEGRKMMSAASAQEIGEKAKMVEPIITSLKSFRAKNKELENLQNVLIPENRRAIEEARAHGDFRENAEYDAAKERRRFLSSHRAQLESDILNAQPIDFRTVHFEGHVIVGSTTVMKAQNGEEIVYHIVGAFDSSPEHNCVAYRTPIGDALMGHKSGTDIELPGNIKARITAVTALPESILDFLQE